MNSTAPRAIREALRHQSWEKASFDVKSLIGKTQVVWVYDAVCKLSGATVALKCYRKELQSAINYQCALNWPCAGHLAILVRHKHTLSPSMFIAEQSSLLLMSALGTPGCVCCNASHNVSLIPNVALLAT